MSSAFERLQKLAEEKRLKEKAEKPLLEIVPVETHKEVRAVSAPSAGRLSKAVSSVSAPSAGSNNLPIAPEKDFARVANSIVRQIPAGVFIGKSKQMYDYLYSLTRGAIKPTRSIRISKVGLMLGSGIRSTHTFYNNVRHLEAIGLINTIRIDGEKGGNSYEVMLPEEISGDLEQLAQLAQAGQLTQPAQKLPVAVNAETALPALGSGLTNTSGSSASKTSFKDNTKNDDESTRISDGFLLLAKRLDEATRKLTGKGVLKTEAEKWGTLADLLILELETAAKKTDSISSVPAFLTEILRRQFFVSRQQQSSIKQLKTKTDTVGKADAASEYQIKPLETDGREAALEQLREFAGDSFLEDFKKWYLEEDWQWLMKQLSIEEKTDAETQGSSDTR